MKTYWNAEVRVNDNLKLCAVDSTLAKMLESAISSAVYYQAIYPSSRVSITGLTESCSACHNNKVVRSVRRTVRCPECKGKGATGRLDDMLFRMPDQVAVKKRDCAKAGEV